jgi:hypothetical protein
MESGRRACSVPPLAMRGLLAAFILLGRPEGARGGASDLFALGFGGHGRGAASGRHCVSLKSADLDAPLA